MKKPQAIKHKLWGRLQRQAHYQYHIYLHPENNQYSVVSDDGEYGNSPVSKEGYSHITNIQDAVDKLNKIRQEHFHSLCNRVIYERRNKELWRKY